MQTQLVGGIYGSSSTILEFYVPGAFVGYIGTNGSSTVSIVSASDELKTNIADAADAGGLLAQYAIKVRQFDWLPESGGQHVAYGMAGRS